MQRLPETEFGYLLLASRIVYLSRFHKGERLTESMTYGKSALYGSIVHRGSKAFVIQSGEVIGQ